MDLVCPQKIVAGWEKVGIKGMYLYFFQLSFFLSGSVEKSVYLFEPFKTKPIIFRQT